MSSIDASLKRKREIMEKTPVAQLQELCTMENEVVTYECLPAETDRKMFSCLVSAFDVVARGSGQSKQEAKHDASANLIAQLIGKDRFRQTLQKVPETPRPVFDYDAISILLDTCVQRNWPVATFDVKKTGESHSPIFTCVCRVSKIQRIGIYSTKSGARQIAAREMLEVIQNLDLNKEQNQIETVVSEPPEKIFRDYHEAKKVPVQSRAIRISDRHNFFLRLPEEDRNEAKEILMDDSTVIHGTTKDRVDLACAALKLKYAISSIPNHQQQFKSFHLLNDHDCVIAAKEEDLYNKVIDHFKTMLNLHEF
ncbi:interferon-inducible double-stranded RNA-dependent protein kinase activator A homolog A-like [Contarinia nasturtii]|uniref:interferon-inducible double-stranded RNA-dependent protein kinase activator A homolog A-like n=1 Tax=Contarinia nasturtii TaxID=265458 RepID=UPI0012D3ADAC|nr:interferon-inducible double-stranded RNA-dependent protein kinase activator A homolog A-like [Contarinia nasturtii]